jgi:hypothetical protein
MTVKPAVRARSAAALEQAEPVMTGGRAFRAPAHGQS